MSGLKERLAGGDPLVTTWVTLPDPLAAEILARQGWDALVVDLQHGAAGPDALLGLLQAAAAGGAPALVRVPWLDPGAVMKALDAGAEGVICPMVEGVAQVREFVAACRYPPEGCRSWGPYRAGLGGAAAYSAAANRQVLPVVQIETAPALEALDAILAEPGVGAVYVGPNDLAWALGYGPGTDREEPALLRCFADVARRARARGIPAGIHTGSPEHARRMVEAGFSWVTLASDAHFLARAAGDALAAFRGR